MNPTAFASLAVAVSYLIGAIPFAYVFVRAAKGIDIRTVGSGNVGATNASRVLGLRGFLLVFLCDMVKGFVPTVALPALVKWRVGETIPDLPVLVALAAIVGHNFPIYLNFRGGKGVSTSLGAALGLDWMASLAAVVAFGISLRINKYVSLSSMIGAVMFASVHFLVVIFYEHKSPFDREHLALSLLTLGLLTMLLIRHRKNFARILDGTEPRVSRRRQSPGFVKIVVLVLLIVAGIGVVAAEKMSHHETVDCGGFLLEEVGRGRTGHQRASHPVFADRGETLAVLCPRYNRLMIYRVTEKTALSLIKDVTLEGQPMDLAEFGGRFWVLERPSGDERHIKSGYVQSYRTDGSKIGPKIAVGFYPSEIAICNGGRTGLVLSMGSSEGEAHHGAPAVEVIDLVEGRHLATLPFTEKGEIPARLSVSASGLAAALVLRGPNQAIAIDLSDRNVAKIVGRSALPKLDYPYVSVNGDDWILMPVDSDRQFALIENLGARLLLSVDTETSEIDVRNLSAITSLGRLPLKASGNWGTVRPTGVAYSAEKGLVGVTNRSGGVHLVAIQSKNVRSGHAGSDPLVSR
jgi:acyl-phosphate glycerol 3-phosphate acyltransferase